MGKSNVVGRIVRIMKRINSVGPGLRGQRVFEFLPNKVLLDGFEFNLEAPLDSIFFAPNSSPSLDANRSIVSWSVPDFDSDSFINAPDGASHFKLVLVSTVLSDFNYNSLLKSYEPINAAENETSGVVFSDAILLSGLVGSSTSLSIDLGFATALLNSVAVISAIGIIFYQEINGNLYELATDNAMRIDSVG